MRGPPEEPTNSISIADHERYIVDEPAIVVVGAGPAGLGTALELARSCLKPIVIDRNDIVGGLARTIVRNGYRFDIGPHRFFTKNREIEQLWNQTLGEDFLAVDRLTRIFYRGRFFHYPLRPGNALLGLGPIRTARSVLSYAWQRLKSRRDEPESFEDWIVEQFGRTLFEIFFKTYTEKVWGIPCDRISKDWAGQRIRGLNLSEAIANAIGLRRRGKNVVKSLVEQFSYPRLGAGQIYEAFATEVEATGGQILLETTLEEIRTDRNTVQALRCAGQHQGLMPVSMVFASAPITDIVRSLKPEAPADVLRAAERLMYRAHITVNLVLDGPTPFPDNWVYIHSPEVQMARIANYNNFGPGMVPDRNTTALSVEYFCFEGDELWVKQDDDLITLAKDELQRVELVPKATLLDGFVVREADSYPTYYLGHHADFEICYEYLKRFTNLSLMGRAGMYRYNNQDHATLTGLYAARNWLGTADMDLFEINAEEEYLEEVSTGSGDLTTAP